MAARHHGPEEAPAPRQPRRRVLTPLGAVVAWVALLAIAAAAAVSYHTC